MSSDMTSGRSCRISGDAPAADVAQPMLEEVRDVRRNRRIHHVIQRLACQTPSAYRAASTLASAATVWFSYRSCGVRSSPSLAAVIATLIAISESPPSSKKLAFRSIESMPRHCDQMRCSVVSICDLPFVGRARAAPAEPDGAVAVPFVAHGTRQPTRRFALCSTQCRCRSKG